MKTRVRLGGSGARRLGPAMLRSMFLVACADRFGWRAQTLEYRFAAPRRWRFDVAWPDAKVAVEFQGQHGPAHRGYYRGTSGLQLDCEKFCAAAADGWRLFPVTYPMLREDMAGVVELVARAVDNRREG